jgi:hypothetical protein
MGKLQWFIFITYSETKKMKNIAIILVILAIIAENEIIPTPLVVNSIEVPITIILSLLGIGLLGITQILKKYC